MDTRMPRMDGLEATRRIRDLEKRGGLDRVPIVAVTAGVLETEEIALREAGYDAVVPKPFRSAAIFRILAERIAATRQTRNA